ncbi:unnamed protein product [Porites lobata]|uniref:Apple domain-containing protein n=1 Tax=Porites lobata TaxID=104759 RepID=A0ABN8N0H7_9CNID|nr:unnamed protein product [Porites lobata]
MHFKLPVPNRILVNHVIQSAQVKSEIECETNCFAHDDCMSVNLAPLQDGNYLCELSNSDHDIHPEDFKQMDRTLFKPVKNLCSRNSCPIRDRCQTGFTDKGYRCVATNKTSGETGNIPVESDDEGDHDNDDDDDDDEVGDDDDDDDDH